MTNSWPIRSGSIFLGNAENQYGYFNYKKHITDAPLKIGSFNGRKIEINLGSTVNQAVRSATRSIKYAPAHFFDFNNLSSKRDLEIVESMYPKTTIKMIEKRLAGESQLGYSRSESRGTKIYHSWKTAKKNEELLLSEEHPLRDRKGSDVRDSPTSSKISDEDSNDDSEISDEDSNDDSKISDSGYTTGEEGPKDGAASSMFNTPSSQVEKEQEDEEIKQQVKKDIEMAYNLWVAQAENNKV